MPNKLPELYLYRLIPGAKQPSRWNIKSRYPVPVVPPAPTAVINPDKPTLTYFPGSTGPVIKQTPGPDTGKITVTAALRIIFSKQTGGSPLRTYNIFMAVNGRIVAQLLNVQIPNPNPPLPFIIEIDSMRFDIFCSYSIIFVDNFSILLFNYNMSKLRLFSSKAFEKSISFTLSKKLFSISS